MISNFLKTSWQSILIVSKVILLSLITLLVLVLIISIFNSRNPINKYIDFNSIFELEYKRNSGLELKDSNKTGIGVFLPEISGEINEQDYKALHSFEEKIESKLEYYLIFESWGSRELLFNPNFIKFAEINDLRIVVTWEPWEKDFSNLSTVQTKYSLNTISKGEHDSYIHEVNSIIERNPNVDFIIRFAHEMNTQPNQVIWYPWQGNPEDYVESFRYLHEKLNKENVYFVYNPLIFEGSSDISKYYPGDEYVDYLGITAINLGNTRGLSNEEYVWRNCEDLILNQAKEMKQYNKEILVLELMSTNIGGDKATWYSDCLNFISQDENIIGVNFMQLGPDISWTLPPFDWRIDSTERILRQVKNELKQGDFK